MKKICIRVFFIINILALFVYNQTIYAANKMCISTMAGYIKDGGQALNAYLNAPCGIWITDDGTIYIADSRHHRVRQIKKGIISTIAGTGIPGYAAEQKLAVTSKLNYPSDLVQDSVGNVYIADLKNHCIRRIDSNGIMSTYAGTGLAGFGNNGTIASTAQLYSPHSIAIDSENNLYIADTGNHCIRIVYYGSKRIYNFAGTGAQGMTGDGGSSLDAKLNSPKGVFVKDANLWIADTGNHKIRKVNLSSQIITTIAGCGIKGAYGDGSKAKNAQLNYPERIVIDNNGDLFIADTQNHRIRRVESANPENPIITFAGGGYQYDDNIYATNARLSFPVGMAVDPSNMIYFADSGNNFVREIQSDRIIKTVAGKKDNNENPPDSTSLNAPSDIKFSYDETAYYVADTQNNKILKVIQNKVITIAGNGETGDTANSGNGGLAINARLNRPVSVLPGKFGNYLYISEPENHWIRRINLTTGKIELFAGNGTMGVPQQYQLAYATSINYPIGLCLDRYGNVYFADRDNYAVFKININENTNMPQDIVRIAGSGNDRALDDGISALDFSFSQPVDIWIDQASQIYIADAGNHQVYVMKKDQTIHAVMTQLNSPYGLAGYLSDSGMDYLVVSDHANHLIYRLDLSTSFPCEADSYIIAGIPGSHGILDDNGRPARLSMLNAPFGVDVSSNGDIFFADTLNDRIRKISNDCGSTGKTIQPIAGFYHVTGNVEDLCIQDVSGMTTDNHGNVYYADSRNHRIVKLDINGNYKAIAGNGIPGFSSALQPASRAQLRSPGGILSVDGKLFIADTGNHAIRMVDADGIMSTLVGDGHPGNSLYDIYNSCLDSPTDIAMDSYGDLFIADTNNHRIIKLLMNHYNLILIAGDGSPGFSGDSTYASNAQLNLPSGLSFDAQGDLYFADTGNHRIRVISQGRISTFAGTGEILPFNDYVLAESANLYSPTQVIIDADNKIYIADSGNHRVRIIKNNKINTFAGNSSCECNRENTPSVLTSLNMPEVIAIDHDNNILIADQCHRILRINAAEQKLQRIAGNGYSQYAGDNKPAVSAVLNGPGHMASDSMGNIYIADVNNHRIRKISKDGTITSLAGTGIAGFSGDGQNARYARIDSPYGVAVNSQGDVFIADTNNHRIRYIEHSTSIIITYAGDGNQGLPSDNTDGILASMVSLNYPRGVAVDQYGNLYIADTGNHKIRKVENGILTTIADSDDLNSPYDVAVDEFNNIFVADTLNHLIRLITPDGNMLSYAGDGTTDYEYGDEYQPAVTTSLFMPTGIALDKARNLYIADSGHYLVRKVIQQSGVIETIAGNGPTDFFQEGQHPTYIGLKSPNGVVLADDGNLVISDSSSHYLYKIISNEPDLYSPASFSCSNNNDTSIQLQWDDTSIIDHSCWIARSKDCEDMFEWYTVVNCNAEHFEDTLLTGGIYHYRIYAFDNGLFSDYQSSNCEIGHPVINVNPERKELPFEAGIFEIRISKDGYTDITMHWSVSTDCEWMTINGSSSGEDNGRISIQYSENSGETRTGSITIQSEETLRPLVFEVIQYEKDIQNYYQPVWISSNHPMTLDISKESLIEFGPISEIGIFDEDLCVGSALIDDTSGQLIEIIISMDSGSPGFPAKDGAREGEPITIRFWNAIQQQETKLEGFLCQDDEKQARFCTFVPDTDYSVIFEMEPLCTISLPESISGYNGQYVTFPVTLLNPGNIGIEGIDLTVDVTNTLMDPQSLTITLAGGELYQPGYKALANSENGNITIYTDLIQKQQFSDSGIIVYIGFKLKGHVDQMSNISLTRALINGYSINTPFIQVSVSNNPPSFTPGGPIQSLEDEDYDIYHWATDITDGDSETYQELFFEVETTPSHLFRELPQIDASGTLTYKPAENEYGTAEMTIVLKEYDGPTSQPVTVDITILPVNDPPSFSKSGDIIISTGSDPFSYNHWAKNIDAGAVNEASQTLMFDVILDTPADSDLFIVKPEIDPNGNISFTPKHTATGSIQFTVYLEDNGGTENGGKCKSDPLYGKIRFDNRINFSGTVSYYGSQYRGISNVSVFLSGNNQIYTTVTTASGYYHFDSIPTGDYMISGEKSDALEGVSGYDAALIAEAAVGKTNFSCYQNIAADIIANESEIISMHASRTAQYAAQRIKCFDLSSQCNHWVFISSNQCESISAESGLTVQAYSDISDLRIIGIRKGDVSGNWGTDIQEPVKTSLSDHLTILAVAGSTMALPVSVNYSSEIKSVDIMVNSDTDALSGWFTCNIDEFSNINNTVGKKMIAVAYKGTATKSNIKGVTMTLMLDVRKKAGSEAWLHIEKLQCNEDITTVGGFADNDTFYQDVHVKIVNEFSLKEIIRILKHVSEGTHSSESLRDALWIMKRLTNMR